MRRFIKVLHIKSYKKICSMPTIIAFKDVVHDKNIIKGFLYIMRYKVKSP